MRAYWEKPQPVLRLVECAEQESTAASVPNGGGGAGGVHGLDIVDLTYLSALMLPRLKRAVADLEQATDEGDPVETITACRRILACALTAKTRADSLERRLP